MRDAAAIKHPLTLALSRQGRGDLKPEKSALRLRFSLLLEFRQEGPECADFSIR